MKQETAQRLLELFLRHGKEQDGILLEILGEEPDIEVDRITSMIGHTMASLYLDAIRPILSEHPALTPPELAGTK